LGSSQDHATPAIIDYEGSQYRTEFWEGQGRDYEDTVERIALRALIPPQGRRIVDLGAGFGRLVDLYAGYDQVVLLDYSRSMMEDARRRLGNDPRFTYVVGSLYGLPFAYGAFDTALMVRVIHHLAEPGVAIGEIHRILASGSYLVMEYANKRNIKAILRYLLRRQPDNPFARKPYEFVPLNYDFHPRFIAELLREAGLTVQAERCVSAFRLPWLKKHVPVRWLAGLDGLLQAPTAPLKWTPSIFLRARTAGAAGPLSSVLFRCPACHSTDLRSGEEALSCQGCGRHWSTRGGIYDFKAPL
jgi:SAM-dependent methyltransferase